MINEGFVVLCDFLLCFCSLILPIQLYYNFWIYVCLTFTLLYPINYLQLSIVVYSVWWTFWVFFPEVNTWFVFTFALFSLWLVQCHAHKCLDPPPWKKKALICIVCICLYCIWFFISNYQCEVTEQVVGKRCALLVLLYHWAVTNVLIPANGPHWDFKIKFSSSSVIFLKQFCLIKGLTGSGSFELWMFQ